MLNHYSVDPYYYLPEYSYCERCDFYDEVHDGLCSGCANLHCYCCGDSNLDENCPDCNWCLDCCECEKTHDERFTVEYPTERQHFNIEELDWLLNKTYAPFFL
jgi:hypothetical protein